MTHREDFDYISSNSQQLKDPHHIYDTHGSCFHLSTQSRSHKFIYTQDCVCQLDRSMDHKSSHIFPYHTTASIQADTLRIYQQLPARHDSYGSSTPLSFASCQSQLSISNTLSPQDCTYHILQVLHYMADKLKSFRRRSNLLDIPYISCGRTGLSTCNSLISA